MKVLREGMESMAGIVNGLETRIIDDIRAIIKQETWKFNNIFG